MPDEKKTSKDAIKPDWTITHGEPDDLGATVGEQREAHREDAARRSARPARDRRGPTRPIGNTDAPVNPDGGDEPRG